MVGGFDLAIGHLQGIGSTHGKYKKWTEKETLPVLKLLVDSVVDDVIE